MSVSSSFPKVSIVIPVYNGGNYLSEAIDSALAQDYSNFEVLVVNDGSDDDGETERIALSYGSKIRYFSKSNGGVASALNLAIENMAGDYFSWLSHDDLYEVNKLSRQVEFLREVAGRDSIICSYVGVFFDDPKKYQVLAFSDFEFSSIRYFLTVNTVLHGCTLLVPRKAFEVCGGFNELLRTTQDYDMWFRLAGNYSFYYIPEVLVKGRQHETQGTVTMSAIVRKECDALVCGFIERLQDQDMLFCPGGAASAWCNLAKISYLRGLTRAARAALKRGQVGCVHSVPIIMKGEFLNFARRVRRLVRK